LRRRLPGLLLGEELACKVNGELKVTDLLERLLTEASA